MNFELKNLISSLFDGEKLIMDGIRKNYFSIVSDALAIVSDIPGDISGFSGLQDEIKGLSNPQSEADLVSFVQQKFSSIEQLSGEKAQKVISAIVGLISAAILVEQAFVN